MDYALKNELYKKARNYINEGKIARIWTGYDDPTDDGCSEIHDVETLKRVFKYCYRMGWPVIRVEGGGLNVISLNEMAYERRDAINRCADLGSPFIEHFKKVIDNGIDDINFNHHCKEMQNWFNSVRNIKLKNTNRFISKTQLIDWFFTLGSDIETILEEKYRDLYESFIIHLLTLENVKECFLLILN